MRITVQAPISDLFPPDSPFKPWVRTIREVRREHMCSVHRLYQHQQSMTVVKMDVLSDEAKLLDTY